MLRMAHRIIYDEKHVLIATGRLQDITIEVVRRAAHDIRSGAPIICADNVEEYVKSISTPISEGGLTASGILLEDIPCARPPFSSMFIEWGRPHCKTAKQIGMFVCDMPEERVVSIALFHSQGGQPTYDGNLTLVKLNESGAPLDYETHPGELWKDSPCIATGLMALAFMHCKNVVRTDATETEGPPDKWLRRQKQPKLRYHILQIDPMKEVLRTEGGSESNGLKKALHICRGHFSTYTAERPLFGKHVGRWFVPAHVRGSSKQGVVVKDYSINSPQN